MDGTRFSYAWKGFIFAHDMLFPGFPGIETKHSGQDFVFWVNWQGG